MKGKTIGYLLAFLGIIGIAISTEKIMALIPFLEGISKNLILIPGIVLTVLGIILLVITNKGTKSEKEVPIYKGKKIVGYRQH